MNNEDMKVVYTFKRQSDLNKDTQELNVIQKTLGQLPEQNNTDEEELKMINISDNKTHKFS